MVKFEKCNRGIYWKFAWYKHSARCPYHAAKWLYQLKWFWRQTTETQLKVNYVMNTIIFSCNRMSQVWSGHGLIKAIMPFLCFSHNSFQFYMISLISLTIHFDKEDEINLRNILIRTHPKNVKSSFSTRKNRIDVLENIIVPTAGFYSLLLFSFRFHWLV